MQPRCGSDDAVLADGYSLADFCPVTNPDILLENGRASYTDDFRAIIDIMPICIRNVGAGCKHTIVADADLRGGVEAAAGADQHIVAQCDLSLVMAKAPRRKRDLAVSVTDDVEVMPCSNMLTAESDVPGFQYHWIIAHYLKVWPYSVFDIPMFDFTKQPFAKVVDDQISRLFSELNFCSLSLIGVSFGHQFICIDLKKVDALEAIRTRNATSRLTGSVPPESLDKILQAGLRASDHALLRPWKIVVEGESRAKLGALLLRLS